MYLKKKETLITLGVMILGGVFCYLASTGLEIDGNSRFWAVVAIMGVVLMGGAFGWAIYGK